MISKVIAVILIILLIVSAIGVFILFPSIEEQVYIDVSEVCNNLDFYQGRTLHTLGNDTGYYVFKHNYINGIVVYSHWNPDKNGGLVVCTGKTQIKSEEGEKFIAMFTEDKDNVDGYKLGDIITIYNGGLNWERDTNDGKLYWWLSEPFYHITKTGYIPVTDPDYSHILNLATSYEDRQDFIVMWTIMWLVWYNVFINSYAFSGGY